MNRRPSLIAAIRHRPRPFASLTVRNAASSFVALAWLSLLSLVTIPLYIRMLGVTEWGIVAACASLQILSNFIDAGFSQIVPRWAAQEADNPGRLARYLTLFRRIYVALGLLLFVLLQVSAGYLSHHWFQVPADRAQALELAIRIVSFQLLFQFINNLHIGFWHGLQRQVLANTRVCAFGTLKHLGTLGVLALGPPEAWLYALSFATIALLEVTTNAITVRRSIGNSPLDAEHSHIALRPLLKEVSVLSGGILVGLLVSQLDRIILSRTVDVESFGVYVVMATLALAFLQLQTPITRAYFPLLVKDIQTDGRVSRRHMTRLVAGTLLTSTLPALIACALVPQLLALWLREPEVVRLGSDPLRLLLLAVAMNGLYGCIYQVIIAARQSHRVLQFNLLSLLMATVVILYLGSSHGLLLGGAIWIAIATTQLFLGISWYMTYRNTRTEDKDQRS